jgi:hypothetical protein
MVADGRRGVGLKHDRCLYRWVETLRSLHPSVAAMVPIYGAVDITGAFLDTPRDADDWPLFGEIPDTASCSSSPRRRSQHSR